MTTPQRAGVGFLLQVLNGATHGNAEAFGKARDRKIASVGLAPNVEQYKSVGGYTETDAKVLELAFDDGSRLAIEDTGQSCCEHRYLTCDDDLAAFAGATLMDIELRDGPDNPETEDDTHEQQFLIVTTSAGSFTVACHNEHNGYYGGICPVLTFTPAPAPVGVFQEEP